MDTMTPEQLVSLFGNVTAVAREFGVSRQTVHNWLRAGEVPQDRMDLYRYRKMVGLIDKATPVRTN